MSEQKKSIMTSGEQHMFNAIEKSGLKFDKDLTPQERYKLSKIAVGYGLDPFMEHIVVLYSKPYITNKGLLHLLNKSERVLPMRKEQDVKIFYDEKKQITRANVTMYIAPVGYTAVEFLKFCIKELNLSKDDALDMMKVEGIGTYSPRQNKYMSDYADIMAIKDAENQLIRKVLAIGIATDDYAGNKNESEYKNIVNIASEKEETPVKESFTTESIESEPEKQPVKQNNSQKPLYYEEREELLKNGLATQAEISMWIANGTFEDKCKELMNSRNKQQPEPKPEEAKVDKRFQSNYNPKDDPIAFLTEAIDNTVVTQSTYKDCLYNYFVNHRIEEKFGIVCDMYKKEHKLSKVTITVYKTIYDYIVNAENNFLEFVKAIGTEQTPEQSSEIKQQGEIV
jgi:hypothetical protein